MAPPTRITDPGVYEMSDALYQADPCEEPSLRSSVAWKLIDKGMTPAHVRAYIDTPREKKRHFDLGSACHAALFGRGKEAEVISGSNYSTNEKISATVKRAFRDAAYSAGRIPLLEPEYEQVLSMVQAARKQIDEMIEAGSITHNPFGPLYSEKVLIWRDRQTNVLCRAALDGLSYDSDMLSEYKTDGQSAAPDLWHWKARKLGYIFRVAFYRRGLEALKLAYSPHAAFFVQETTPPYLMSYVRIEDELIELADRDIARALRIWRRCIETSQWPGYSPEGYSIGLTEREQRADIEQATTRSSHLASEDIAGSLDKPTPLVRKK